MGAQRKRSEADIYHVVTRGTGRQLIFEDDADRRRFLTALVKRLAEEHVELYAWCLMSNHVHLLLRAPLEQISASMRKALGEYALYFNDKSGRTGHLFQARFGSEPVTSDEQLLAAVCYIHNNPVKAGMSSAENYPWSSFGEYVGEARYCQTSFVLDVAGGVEELRRLHHDLGPAAPLGPGSHRNATRAMPDACAISLAKTTLGEIRLEDVKSLEPGPRREAILLLKQAGLSVRQIERLTGIGRNIIQRS